MSKNVSFKISEDEMKAMIDYYQSFQKDNSGDYIVFFAKKDNVTITIFESKKGHTITFAGEKAQEEANVWRTDLVELTPEIDETPREWKYLDSQIGSDEVGVVDLFLPLVVVGAYVNEFDIAELKKLGVMDSKKLTDNKILKLAPKLIEKYRFEKIILSNDKYVKASSKDENAQSIKAKLHNRVLLKLHKEYPEVVNIFVDQFVNEKSYFKYLQGGKDEVVTNVLLKTKGESNFPAVALASVIARYYFLLEKQRLEKKYGLEFPFGAAANKKSVGFAHQFIDKYGLEELMKISKTNFSSFIKLIS